MSADRLTIFPTQQVMSYGSQELPLQMHAIGWPTPRCWSISSCFSPDIGAQFQQMEIPEPLCVASLGCEQPQGGPGFGSIPTRGMVESHKAQSPRAGTSDEESTRGEQNGREHGRGKGGQGGARSAERRPNRTGGGEAKADNAARTQTPEARKDRERTTRTTRAIQPPPSAPQAVPPGGDPPAAGAKNTRLSRCFCGFCDFLSWGFFCSKPLSKTVISLIF